MTGHEFRRIRRRLGLTQATLAERLAVTPTSVARWERGEVPIRETVARLVQLLAPMPSNARPKRNRR